MTDTPRPRRSRIAERAEHLYTSRTAESQTEQAISGVEEYTPNETRTYFDGYETNEPAVKECVPKEANVTGYTPNEESSVFAGYTPNEESSGYVGYTSNGESNAYDSYTPNEETICPRMEQPNAEQETQQPDYASYYSQEAEVSEFEQQSQFAPPPSMSFYTFEPQVPTQQSVSYTKEQPANHVYRVREATWADEQREEVLAESELGYQVSEEAHPERKKSHALRNGLIALAVLALLCAGAWLMRDQLMQLLGVQPLAEEATEEPVAAVVTPEPVKAYDPAPVAALSDTARGVIAQLSGTLNMENYIVTDRHVVTRHQRENGSYDFYLFTAAEGRLLCYFEGLDKLDMIPLENGNFYVRQAPWLVAPNGSALIRTADIEAAVKESVFLHPMYRGWAIVESEEDGHVNFVNATGQVMSYLWFSRAFPFTGEYTLAYVDTGSTAAAGDRYLLFVVSQDGAMSRWLAAENMEDVLAAVNGMAYMRNGSLYRLPDTSAPVLVSPEIIVYADCEAMVVQDPVSGKYGLFVRGEQHYDYAYDAIHPLESDIQWTEKTLGSGEASITLRAVSSASYPQPLSHSFVLEKEGVFEYVALSATTSCPILLDGEF